MYCTPQEAQARGARATDPAALERAIREAGERIDAYTGDHFEPEDETRTLKVTGSVAPTRRRLLEVTQVTVAAAFGVAARVIPDTAYRITPSALELRTFGSDILVAGAEPWSGGWAGLVGDVDGAYIAVTGRWGWQEVPSAVREACAILAAELSPATFVPAANAEGDAEGVPPTSSDDLRDPQPERVEPAQRRDKTTGNAEADRLLSLYVASPYKFG